MEYGALWRGQRVAAMAFSVCSILEMVTYNARSQCRYYNESHQRFKKEVRKFFDEVILVEGSSIHFRGGREMIR